MSVPIRRSVPVGATPPDGGSNDVRSAYPLVPAGPSVPAGPDAVDRVARAALALARDAADALLIERLHQAGIRPVLLKGPVTARRLYPGEHRPRVDCDLLVPPAQFARARAVLVAAGLRPYDPCPYAQMFGHPSGQAVDLHWTLPVATVRAERLWAVLSRHIAEFQLGGTVVDALDLPAHACHLAIHAVSVPARSQAARRDLDRAAARIPLAIWREAMGVADELGARPAVAAALRTGSPACRALADALGLPVQVPFAQRLWLADTSLLLSARQILRAAPPEHRRAMLRRWLLPTMAEIASRGRRPEVRAVTPAALPPLGRMLWYRARQIVLFAAAVHRAARTPAGTRRLDEPAAPVPMPSDARPPADLTVA
ncbi:MULTISPECIES: nucleotidyltransferase family protein [Pseudofrankia]|uniref:nucleotidyltransferase family protein n=1 Tax=Pseudofrankia TaxID=2994363 RepID=UPI000234B81C|nr:MULTISPECIES: nucleotidyltransferase family protein [Pseudofrankia]OHV36073.1 hypothetical protein BCD49_21075 [Pseudofrankia sp. EUN1h]